VTGHDDVEAGGARVDVHFIHVMEDVNADAFQLKCEVKRDPRCPLALVVVSPDRIDRRYDAQLLENLGPADVARMNDVLNARECTDRFGAKQSVRVGDEAYRFQWVVSAAPDRNRSSIGGGAAAAQASVRVWIIDDRNVILAHRSCEMLVHDSNLRQHGRYRSTATTAGAKSARRGVIAIHHDSGRYVLIFCQIRDFESYNANNKSNKSI
jgi:hypothetical protein